MTTPSENESARSKSVSDLVSTSDNVDSHDIISDLESHVHEIDTVGSISGAGESDRCYSPSILNTTTYDVGEIVTGKVNVSTFDYVGGGLLLIALLLEEAYY